MFQEHNNNINNVLLRMFQHSLARVLYFSILLLTRCQTVQLFYQTRHFTKLNMLCFTKFLCHNVGNHFLTRAVLDFDCFSGNLFSNEMEIYINTFRSSMKLWIFCHADNRLIILIYNYAFIWLFIHFGN